MEYQVYLHFDKWGSSYQREKDYKENNLKKKEIASS